MKKLLFLLLFLTSTVLKGQELVPNNSFENPASTYSTITTLTGNWKITAGCGVVGDTLTIQDWVTTSASPDRIIQGTAPCYDNDLALSGVGYLVVGNNEAVKANLNDTLEPGCLYQFSSGLNLERFNNTLNGPSSVSFTLSDPYGNTIVTPSISWNIWQIYSTPITASSASTTIEIQNLVNGQGLQVDNVSLIKLGCPLEVQFLNFEARIKGCGVFLYWSTASEINNQYFEIQRSTDGRNFETLDYISGAGNSSSIINYEYEDCPLPDQSSFYRLKQVDFDGKSTYSKIIPVKITGKSLTIDKIYNINGSEIKELVPGLNIVRYSDGSIQKVIH